ncbi:hypothetical protein [Nonomuraea rhodomycinica]|uniref:Uncharacterized protein n=1 Tax=Nonomuraea rhodomycinica TaxID=1712872 RepID=A0A7Y6IVW1_9ACTN|nr:hypothetical protein [Nonomuraea rhodomycinica]NUW45051.1 hypothetical protein [Nonomuraea rhodomycinica]
MTEAPHHVHVWPTVRSIPVSAVTEGAPSRRLRPPRPQDIAGGTGTGRDTSGGARTGGSGTPGSGAGETGAGETGAGARGNPAAEFGFSGDPAQHGVPDDDLLHAQRVWDGTLAANRLDALGVNAERQRVRTEDITTTVGFLVDGHPEDTRRALQSVIDHTAAHVLALDLGDVDGAGAVLRELASRHPERVTAWYVEEQPEWRGGTATWGECLAKLLRLDTAEVFVVMEGSVALEGDAITPLVAAIDDGAVAAGWTAPEPDGRTWRETRPGEGARDVPALGGELLAVRRSVALGDAPEETRDGTELSRSLRGVRVVPADRLPVRRLRSV